MTTTLKTIIGIVILAFIAGLVFMYHENPTVPAGPLLVATSTTDDTSTTTVPGGTDAGGGEFGDPTDTSTQPTPHIDSISPTSGPVGTTIQVKGTNLAGFEGDLTLWVQNSKGESGIVYATNRNTGGSTSPNVIFGLIGSMLCSTDTSYSGVACPSGIVIVPGVYTIYTSPWGHQSNSVQFTVTASGTTPNQPEQPVACTMEAKMCPDGKTYVGRQGPMCEFAPCPGN